MGGFDYAGKVRALLAMAEGARKVGNDDEAASFEAKAHEWQKRYRIAQEERIAVDPTSEVPMYRDVILRPNDRYSDVAYAYPEIARLAAQHAQVLIKIQYTNGNVVARLVGYEADVDYATFLWTSAHLMFSTRIDPIWDSTRSEAENIFFMRNAGHTRREIAGMAWGQNAGDVAANRSKVQRIYVREATSRGETPRATGLGFDGKAYREAYADEFVATLRRRFRIARDASDSVGGGVVLHGRSERVRAYYDELFPPQPQVEVTPYVDPTKECAKCAKAKTTCNDHRGWRIRTWTKADERRELARYNSTSRAAGAASGKDAAEGVEVVRTTPRARRVQGVIREIEG